MSIWTQISDALKPVREARELCPFDKGKPQNTSDPCRVCKQRSNGDGGHCRVDRACYSAVAEIERLIS